MASDQGPKYKSALLRDELVPLAQAARADPAAGRRSAGVVAIQADQGGGRRQFHYQGGSRRSCFTEYGVTSESHREQLTRPSTGERRSQAGGTVTRMTSHPLTSITSAWRQARRSSGSSRWALSPACCRPPEYAEVATLIGPVNPGKVQSFVGLRLRRQSELSKRSSPPRQYFVLDEAVIRRHVGITRNRSIMPDQLRFAADRAEQADLVTVRVIPFDAGAHPGADRSVYLAGIRSRAL